MRINIKNNHDLAICQTIASIAGKTPEDVADILNDLSINEWANCPSNRDDAVKYLRCIGKI